MDRLGARVGGVRVVEDVDVAIGGDDQRGAVAAAQRETRLQADDGSPGRASVAGLLDDDVEVAGGVGAAAVRGAQGPDRAGGRAVVPGEEQLATLARRDEVPVAPV